MSEEIKVKRGRPRDPVTRDMVCPNCGKQTLNKGGTRYMYNKSDGMREVPCFLCSHCHYQTTKPIIPTG